MNRGCLIGFGVFLIIVIIGLGIYFYQCNIKEVENYEVVQFEKIDIIKKMVVIGVIWLCKEVMVKLQVFGVVDEIYVEEGELVIKGQKFVCIKLVFSEVNINMVKFNVELACLCLQEV